MMILLVLLLICITTAICCLWRCLGCCCYFLCGFHQSRRLMNEAKNYVATNPLGILVEGRTEKETCNNSWCNWSLQ
jgi:hypothetical protein